MHACSHLTAKHLLQRHLLYRQSPEVDQCPGLRPAEAKADPALAICFFPPPSPRIQPCPPCPNLKLSKVQSVTMHTYLLRNEVLVEVEDEVRVEEVAFAQGLTPRETKPVLLQKICQATWV
jgi:hypothetical protein